MRGTGRPRAFLVVEDDAEALELLCSVLSTKFPHSLVHSAGEGRSGLESFQRHLPEITITDLMMPVLDGIEMVRLIRLVQPGAKVIAVTGFHDLEKISPDGAALDRVLFKPLSFSELFDAIDALAAGPEPGGPAV